MQEKQDSYSEVLRQLKLPVLMTWAGLIAERLVVAFWPLWTLFIALAAVLMLGGQDYLSLEFFWVSAVICMLAALYFLIRGVMRLRWPAKSDALARLDADLVGQPLASLSDTQAIGQNDSASQELWHVHRERMRQRALENARAVAPDLRISARDPYALRYIALLGLMIAVLFGSFARISSVADHAIGRPVTAASGPVWEGWIEPPGYTGLPPLYLADQGEVFSAPDGSLITVRFYGVVGALSLSETLSGRLSGIGSATDPEHEFTLEQSGELRIDGPGGRSWQVTMLPDTAPAVMPLEQSLSVSFDGKMSLPFKGTDDYGVTSGKMTAELELVAVARDYGLALPPEPRMPIALDLPLPIVGDRGDFTEVLSANLSKDVWAHLPVSLSFEVTDAAGQSGYSERISLKLPARRFFDPLAAALVEMRRDLLWSRGNARRVTQLLRAISYAPEGESLFRSDVHYMKLRQILVELERVEQFGMLSTQTRDGIAEDLWALALEIEEGDLDDALERMQEAQERLNDAMRNGASREEITRLMQELRDATQDYLRQKSQQAERQEERQGEPGETIEMSQNDLQEMMDHIQDLMEQGRMAEAQRALEEFQQMMENMRTSQGEGGQGPGQQAMDGLADTLREQQGLSDEAFRDLQDQFNGGLDKDDAERGVEQGRNDSGDAESEDKSLAERQKELRDQLRAQNESMPDFDGSDAGDEAGRALDRAGRAMGEAEGALREGDNAQALDRQAEAMDALREGMRSLSEAMRDQQNGQPGQSRQSGQQPSSGEDPLGRQVGDTGGTNTQDEMLNDQDLRRRAGELMDEIRKRSSELDRPEPERDYLKRLLDRF